MTADEVNEQMEALGERLDKLGAGVDKTLFGKVNGLIADWQDFYWGEFEAWPVNTVATWEDQLPNLQTAVARMERDAGVLAKPVESAPVRTVQLADEKVYGDWPLWMKVGAVTILAFGAYKVLRAVKVL